MAGAPDMSFWLGRKYSILQQQADATTQNASTAATTGAAAANLDRTRANLMPGESAASIARMGAETNLTNQQASVVVPESRARVRNMDADTSYTGTQNRVLTRTSLTPMRDLFGSGSGSAFSPSSPLGGVMGTQFRAPRLQDYDRQRGGLNAAGLDYVNGF